jgi:hypothetical protein
MKHARQDYDRIQDPAMLIPMDEPVFLLRAQDMCAAATVHLWANLAEKFGAKPVIVSLARQQADRMEKWRKHKVPDLLLKPEFNQGGSTVNDEEQRSQEEEERQKGEQPSSQPEQPGEAASPSDRRQEIRRQADRPEAEQPDRGQTHHEPESPAEGGA